MWDESWWEISNVRIHLWKDYSISKCLSKGIIMLQQFKTFVRYSEIQINKALLVSSLIATHTTIIPVNIRCKWCNTLVTVFVLSIRWQHKSIYFSHTSTHHLHHHHHLLDIFVLKLAICLFIHGIKNNEKDKSNIYVVIMVLYHFFIMFHYGKLWLL